ncbi:hypothetical protein [Anaerolinea thermophila]|uniref:Uncharacterized protein n=1 Tax=Anaerolinea thermophila (strain DSM 14523 / JCM 11388 / NBRC 100420 / UNI-1) TaxID=926569 RepID=E8N254_ANATU|nr:hypothetical protein [Anaerolinea thermophila]BAJ65001.1 hypothetical protein ANT_29750 [Anaerolinea thermophila UNI-1]
MEKRFKVLRFMGTLYKILGVINGVVTLILAVGICAVSVLGGASMADFAREYGMHGTEVFGALGGVLLGGGVLILGGLSAVFVYALGEGVYVLIAIEENTRAAAMRLQAPIPPAE